LALVVAPLESGDSGVAAFAHVSSQPEERLRVDLRAFNVAETPCCLLVEHASGVIWMNQVGGHAVMPMQLEGLLVPLDARLDLTEDPLENHAPYVDDLKSPLSRVADWLRWAQLDDLLEPRDNDFVAEAWIPVRIRDDVPADNLLAPFRGRQAVITYENSD
jgi:hypothetical protein